MEAGSPEKSGERVDCSTSPEREKLEGFYITSERLAGYREALEAAGIGWTDVPTEERNAGGGRARDAGHDAAAALLDRASRPTPILAMSDEPAFGVLRAAGDGGIDARAELWVFVFDDTWAAAAAEPPLTTIRQPHELKGATA